MDKNTKMTLGRAIGILGISLALYFNFVKPLFESKVANMYVNVFCWSLVAVAFYLMGIFPKNPYGK